MGRGMAKRLTEAEWLTGDRPPRMIERLPPSTSERKYRLFVCAYLRRTISLPTSEPAWRSVDVAERWADGAATKQDVRAFRVAEPRSWTALTPRASQAALVCADSTQDRAMTSGLIREVFGNPFCPVSRHPHWLTPTVASLAQAAYAERVMPSGALEADRLTVLADALEDAGCSDEAILEHLRSAGPHVRGCWALDLVLDRS